MARTPYTDPEAEKEYQSISEQSSKPMGDTSETLSKGQRDGQIEGLDETGFDPRHRPIGKRPSGR